MGSDSLDKPDRPRSLIETFQVHRDKVFVHMQRFKPRSFKPWLLIPDLMLSCPVLLRALTFYSSSLIWTVVIGFLAACWDCLVLFPLNIITTYLVPDSMKAYLAQFNWADIGFKLFSRTVLAVYACFAIALFLYGPWGPGGQWPDASVKQLPYLKFDIDNYFTNFQGESVCNIRAVDLYAPPIMTEHGHGYCNSRISLLKAMSEGGRHGFGTPYVSHGCHYRWFSIDEICAILDRFDAVVFIGDQNLEMIYAGFNILLRKDLGHGALKLETTTDKLVSCTCNSQFTDPTCREWFVRSSKDVLSRTTGLNSRPLTCERLPHALLSISGFPASANTILKFNDLVRPAPPSNYKRIPIIHSLTSHASTETANDSLNEFLGMADATKRKTPMLWIGPTAAGHVELKGRMGNQEIWRFACEMARIAKEKDVETLGLWNLTVQADSYDGKAFGEDVSIVAAMMVVNWLARLESS